MTKRLSEYLRRNQLHAASVGTRENTRAILDRLRTHRKPSRWLVELLEGILERAGRVSSEMARHRDEMSPYKRAP